MSVYPLHERQTSSIVGVGNAAMAHYKKETTSVGNVRATGIAVTIRNNYAARYNFAVDNFNNLQISEKKRTMFGDLFLVHRYAVVVFWVICMITGGISIVVKGLVAIPIVISLVYIATSIYNTVIFFKNETVLHDKLMIQNNMHDGNNEWYRVPIHTRIQDSAALAAVGGDDSAAIAAIRHDYTNMEEIKIMVYTENYVTRYTYFPTKSITIHIAMFVVAFIFSIVMVAIKTS